MCDSLVQDCSKSLPGRHCGRALPGATRDVFTPFRINVLSDLADDKDSGWLQVVATSRPTGRSACFAQRALAKAKVSKVSAKVFRSLLGRGRCASTFLVVSILPTPYTRSSFISFMLKVSRNLTCIGRFIGLAAILLSVDLLALAWKLPGARAKLR